MSITYHSHTADIRMVVKAKTLEELFRLSVMGMSAILKENACDKFYKADNKITIEVAALDYTNLLIDFLSEVLSYTYIENAIFCEVNFLKFSGHTLKAEVSGMHIQQFDEEIKAVTYHEADVHKDTTSHWRTGIIFDI